MASSNPSAAGLSYRPACATQMASYFLRSKHVSRGKGARVTAAYRAGKRIRDERTGETYDYSDRQDVAYEEVVLPAEPITLTHRKPEIQSWN